MESSVTYDDDIDGSYSGALADLDNDTLASVSKCNENFDRFIQNMPLDIF